MWVGGGNSLNLRVKNYEETDWERVRRFLESDYGNTNPTLDRRLFSWQHRGYRAVSCEQSPTRLLCLNDDVVGFFGAIPVWFRVCDEVCPGVETCIWVVHESLRNKGVGVYLLTSLEKEYPHMANLGGNAITQRIFETRHFTIVPEIKRFIKFLHPDIQGVLSKPKQSSHSVQLLSSFVHSPASFHVKPILESDCDRVAEYWKLASSHVSFFGLEKNTEFYSWRYRLSEGFDYKAFHVEGLGMIIYRSECIRTTDKPEVVLGYAARLIEIVPNKKSAYAYMDSCSEAKQILRGFIDFLRSKNHLLIDFQYSGDWFDSFLSSEDFIPAFSRSDCDFAATFDPVCYRSPINLLYRSAGTSIVPSRTFFLKSDADMDRPVSLKQLSEIRVAKGEL